MTDIIPNMRMIWVITRNGIVLVEWKHHGPADPILPAVDVRFGPHRADIRVIQSGLLSAIWRLDGIEVAQRRF